MASRRSLSISSTLISRRLHPSSTHILHSKDDDTKSHCPDTSPFRPALSNFLPEVPHNRTTSFGILSQERMRSKYLLPIGLGSSFCRHMSSTIGDDSGKLDDIGYMADVISDKTVEAVASQVPVMSEVAAAAADSSYPIAALQYFIDGIHCYTGLNWWASIALATLFIRGATIPLLIRQLKDTSKLSLMRPRLEELQQEMKDKMMDANELSEQQEKVKALFKEFGVNPLSPLKGIFIQGPIFLCFFLAIRNMAEKVPSFENGGALWFVDLTTPDNLFVLPILTALTFWIAVECNMQEGMENNPIAGTMKKFCRVFAVLSVPFMAAFPKALFCYWLTSNMFTLAYGSVIKNPEVKRLLDLPVPGANVAMSLSLKQNEENILKENEENILKETEENVLKESEGNISSSSLIRQRLRSLERHVKGRKKM